MACLAFLRWVGYFLRSLLLALHDIAVVATAKVPSVRWVVSWLRRHRCFNDWWSVSQASHRLRNRLVWNHLLRSWLLLDRLLFLLYWSGNFYELELLRHLSVAKIWLQRVDIYWAFIFTRSRSLVLFRLICVQVWLISGQVLDVMINVWLRGLNAKLFLLMVSKDALELLFTWILS